ncbi:MAG: AbrB/MazE/SpoVT family DNA-binding domain-containing protein [Bdellovibrionales bacterium]
MKGTITQIGNSLGMIIPKEILTAMNAQKGESIFIMPTKDGFIVKLSDPDVERQLDIAQKYADKYREVFQKLAE